MMLVTLMDSDKLRKKFMVTIGNKTIHFGDTRYEDFTIHGDKARKASYISRHKKKEKWGKSGIFTAGWWSRWLLWNEPTLDASVAAIEKRFKVRIQNEAGKILPTSASKRLVSEWKKDQGVQLYTPHKYFAGLPRTKIILRLWDMKRHREGKQVSWATDHSIKTKPSTRTTDFRNKHPGTTSLRGKAKATGVPIEVLHEVYKRGYAAWESGHRPGTTPQQWGHGRVNSFLMKGPTYHSTDADLAKMADAAASAA